MRRGIPWGTYIFYIILIVVIISIVSDFQEFRKDPLDQTIDTGKNLFGEMAQYIGAKGTEDSSNQICSTGSECNNAFSECNSSCECINGKCYLEVN